MGEVAVFIGEVILSLIFTNPLECEFTNLSLMLNVLSLFVIFLQFNHYRTSELLEQHNSL